MLSTFQMPLVLTYKRNYQPIKYQKCSAAYAPTIMGNTRAAAWEQAVDINYLGSNMICSLALTDNDALNSPSHSIYHNTFRKLKIEADSVKGFAFHPILLWWQ